MTSLLVFNTVIDIVSHVGIFDTSCELAPLQPSHWFTSSPLPPPILPCLNKYRGCIYALCNGGWGGGVGYRVVRVVRRASTLYRSYTLYVYMTRFRN
jgi:hypothetical protein